MWKTWPFVWWRSRGSKRYRTLVVLAVETVWLFERKGSSIYGRVYYRCVFDGTVLIVPKWIQSYCNAHTREEFIVTYGHWISAARELLEAETGVRALAWSTRPGRRRHRRGRASRRTADDVFPETAVARGF